jgi:ATP-dependent Zn protease
MQLNRRHKVGLFLTIVIVGAGLLLDVSAKQSVGLALLSLATTWLVGNINLKSKNETFQVGAPKIVENLTTQQSSEKALPDESSQNSETDKLIVRARHGGSWFWMIVSTLIFVILLGLGIFNMSWQLMVGEAEKAGESLGKTLIPILLLGFGARQA